MSTAEQTTQIPTGAWNLDPVHSSIGFAVGYSGVGTFRGTFADFDATLVDGRLEGALNIRTIPGRATSAFPADEPRGGIGASCTPRFGKPRRKSASPWPPSAWPCR